MDDVTIREARPGDERVLAASFRAWWDQDHVEEGHLHPGPSIEGGASGHPDSIGSMSYTLAPDEGLLRDWPPRYQLLAERKGAMVGFINGRRERTSGAELVLLGGVREHFIVSNLFVVPAERRRGVGSSLVRELLARAAADGLLDVAVQSAWDEHVIDFYRAHGFAPYAVHYVRPAPRTPSPSREGS